AAIVGSRRFLSRPLLVLVETAQKWRAGQLSQRAALPENGSELGLLGAELNKMAHAIAGREHERTLLLAALDHRVKNMPAVVQSLSMQSFKGAGMAEQRRAFADRLVALAAAHDLLKREAWQSVDLGDLVRAAIAPFRVDRADRIVIDGPPARLNAD